MSSNRMRHYFTSPKCPGLFAEKRPYLTQELLAPKIGRFELVVLQHLEARYASVVTVT